MGAGGPWEVSVQQHLVHLCLGPELSGHLFFSVTTSMVLGVGAPRQWGSETGPGARRGCGVHCEDLHGQGTGQGSCQLTVPGRPEASRGDQGNGLTWTLGTYMQRPGGPRAPTFELVWGRNALVGNTPSLCPVTLGVGTAETEGNGPQRGWAPNPDLEFGRKPLSTEKEFPKCPAKEVFPS